MTTRSTATPGRTRWTAARALTCCAAARALTRLDGGTNTAAITPDPDDGTSAAPEGDTANYYDSTEGVTVDLAAGTGMGGTAAGDTLTNIENVQGSKYGDMITGDDEANDLFGWLGDDTLTGGDGKDMLRGHMGDDSLAGGAGDDWLRGGAGADKLYGGRPRRRVTPPR